MANHADKQQRSVLPIPERAYAGLIKYDAKDPEAKFPPGAPNVLVILLDAADAGERHETQYFEMFVNRGIYHKGWTAVTRHSTPWVVAALPAFDDDVWELYAPDDWTQAHNIAAENPQMLKELQRLFLIEAARHDVLPLDDRRVERFNSDLAGRPTLIKGKSQMLFSGMGRLSENAVINPKNKSKHTFRVLCPQEFKTPWGP